MTNTTNTTGANTMNTTTVPAALQSIIRRAKFAAASIATFGDNQTAERARGEVAGLIFAAEQMGFEADHMNVLYNTIDEALGAGSLI